MVKKHYIDRKKLQKAIKDSGILIKDLHTDLGLTYTGWWLKSGKGANFTESEIQYLVKKFGDKIIKQKGQL